MRAQTIRFLAAALLSAASLVFVNSPITTAAQDYASVRQVDKAFVQAAAQGDAAAIGKMLDGEFTWTDADGKTLSWTMGRDRVEITSSANVLTRSVKGVLWVYHDPHYQPDVVGLQAADTVDWLLPKR